MMRTRRRDLSASVLSTDSGAYGMARNNTPFDSDAHIYSVLQRVLNRWLDLDRDWKAVLLGLGIVALVLMPFPGPLS